MCQSMADIQSVATEIRWGKKKQDKNIMSTSATHGGHNELKNKAQCLVTIQTVG